MDIIGNCENVSIEAYLSRGEGTFDAISRGDLKVSRQQSIKGDEPGIL
jgi:hypothetical protein